jgi:hypothetical protein
MGSRGSFPGGTLYHIKNLWNFLFTIMFRPDLGLTQPHIQLVQEALFLVVKRPWREADNPPLSSAEIKIAWIYTSTPQYDFIA